ncbi:MAG: hypothetical protein JST02_01135 [Bacteroidetes bacterium]|nr:hypothetical protein [Bacteroidota bacterium]
MSNLEKFGLAVEIITLGAVVIAVLTELHVRTLMKNVNAVLKNVETSVNKSYQIIESISNLQQISAQISESISTKYVGNFPHNMDEMVRLIPKTEKSLTIICDVPAFGHFSNPEVFDQYNLAIIGLLTRSRKPQINMVTYDENRRLKNSMNQFKMPFSELKSTSTYREYFERWPDREDPNITTLEDFCKWLDERHVNFQYELKDKGAKVYESQIDLRAFVWIIDEKEAIFSFYNYGSENREVSFRTNDKKLIRSLLLISKESQENSTPLPNRVWTFNSLK